MQFFDFSIARCILCIMHHVVLYVEDLAFRWRIFRGDGGGARLVFACFLLSVGLSVELVPPSFSGVLEQGFSYYEMVLAMHLFGKLISLGFGRF